MFLHRTPYGAAAGFRAPAGEGGGFRPGIEHYAREWWLQKPMRMIQTNLREIDATMDMDTYMQRVREYKANVVLFNVGGIVANYPTELPFQYRNPNLKNDLVGEALERLHAEGIRVIGRFDFSKINESLAAQRPEWLYKSVKGKTVNYNGQVHTCINGGYQQKYLFKILGEAIDRYPLDGIFFNMIGYVTRDYSGNYHGICRCDSCRSRFKDWCGVDSAETATSPREGGLDLPTKEDSGDVVFRRYQEFRRQTSDELFYRVNKFIKSKRKDIAVCTYIAAGVDIIRRESNSALGRSLPEWNYSGSDNVRTALGSWKNKVVANAAVHFVDYPYRHSAVSPYLNELRLVQNLLNGGWLDYYVIGPLQRQEDRLGLGLVRDVFRFHAQNERWFTNTRSAADVCLVKGGGQEYAGLFRILAENHILFDVMSLSAIAEEQTPKALEDYPLVVLPDVRNLSEALCSRLDAYVANGGKILMTGMTSTRDAQGNPRGALGLKAAGVREKYKMRAHKRGTYLRIGAEDKKRLACPEFSAVLRTPYGGHLTLDALDLVYLDSDFLECEPVGNTEGLLRFIPVGMYGPPEKCYYTEVTDIPGLFHSRFGKGSCAFFPWHIGRHYQKRSNHGHSLLVTAAIDGLLGLERSVIIDASPLVEVSRQVSIDGGFEWVGLVNHSGQNGTAFHKPIPISGIRVRLKARRGVRRVRLLRDPSLPVSAWPSHDGREPKAGEYLKFSVVKDGWVECVVPRLERFEIVLFEYGNK